MDPIGSLLDLCPDTRQQPDLVPRPRDLLPPTLMARNDLSTLSTLDLQRELARRTRRTAQLERRREVLLKKLAAIEAELGAAPPPPRRLRRAGASSASPSAGVRGPRPRNSATLTDALAAVLKDRTMGVAEAADAVRAAGYASNAANFKLVVNATLLKPPFRRVERGRYTVA